MLKIIARLGSLPIFPKLAITFLLVLTPLFYIGLKMNESGSAIVREEIGNSLVSRTELYMDLLDHDFDQIISLQREYMYDEDLLKLSISSEIMSSMERTDSILRLKKRLDLLKGTSSIVENVIAFIPSLDRVVSSNANAIDVFDEVLFQRLSQPVQQVSSTFVVWNNTFYITMSYPGIDDVPQFLLVTELSEKALTSKLKQFSQESGIAVLMSSVLQWSVASSDDQGWDEQWFAAMDEVDNDIASTITFNEKEYLIVGKQSDLFTGKLLMLAPTEQIEKPLSEYRNWVLAMYGIAVLVILLFAFGMYQIIQRPLKQLVRSFRKIEQGKFDISIDYKFTDEFGYLYKQLNAMVRELDRLIHEVYEQQYLARVAELRHLQSQINPHFLYNTFFILYRMARQEGNVSIEHLTKHLGDYFEFITRDGAEEVALQSEVSHAQSYTEIQAIRFSNRIQVRFAELPKAAEAIMVPRLILQPIIENAFVHSLEKRAKGGLLEVDFTLTEQYSY